MPPQVTASLFDGHLVKIERVKKRVKGADLAVALDIWASTMSAYENGRKVIPEDLAQRIADFLGVPLDSIRRNSGGIE